LVHRVHGERGTVADWVLLAGSQHGVEGRQKTLGIGDVKAVASMNGLHPVDVLHPVQFSVEQLLLVICILQLPQ